MACSCVCFRSEQAMWRLTISVRNKTVMTRALKTTMWSAELTTICGEFLLKTCVGFHPICMTTVLVCVLKLQHGRSSVPQVRRRARQLWLERKRRLWSAELPTICGEYLLKTCVGCHPICMITELVCVLKLQHGRSSVPQVRRRARQDALRQHLYFKRR